MTTLPRRARPAARFSDSVVLPVPPLLPTTTMMLIAAPNPADAGEPRVLVGGGVAAFACLPYLPRS